jgi:hypothetical protein
MVPVGYSRRHVQPANRPPPETITAFDQWQLS